MIPPSDPFFIVGSPRSGTTLLRFMLSSHSRIYVPDETGFIPFLRVPVDEPLTRKQVRFVLERIGRLNRFWRGMVDDAESFYNSLPEPRLRHVLDALYRKRMAEHDAVRWGDKTPLYVQYMPRLNAIFPHSRFVHAVRDGRDAALSARAKWGRDKPYLDLYYLLTHWARNVRAGRESGRAMGSDRYLEVRYESLVDRPESILKMVCAFLGESFEPDMLDHTRLAIESGGGVDGHVEAQRPVTAESVGRWRTGMSGFEKKLADHLAGKELAALDYPLANLGPFTPGEKLRIGYLSGKFALSDLTRTLLYRAGILTLNRNRRS